MQKCLLHYSTEPECAGRRMGIGMCLPWSVEMTPPHSSVQKASKASSRSPASTCSGSPKMSCEARHASFFPRNCSSNLFKTTDTGNQCWITREGFAQAHTGDRDHCFINPTGRLETSGGDVHKERSLLRSKKRRFHKRSQRNRVVVEMLVAATNFLCERTEGLHTTIRASVWRFRVVSRTLPQVGDDAGVYPIWCKVTTAIASRLWVSGWQAKCTQRGSNKEVVADFVGESRKRSTAICSASSVHSPLEIQHR